jgi:hypothetical protein
MVVKRSKSLTFRGECGNIYTVIIAFIILSFVISHLMSGFSNFILQDLFPVIRVLTDIRIARDTPGKAGLDDGVQVGWESYHSLSECTSRYAPFFFILAVSD